MYYLFTQFEPNTKFFPEVGKRESFEVCKHKWGFFEPHFARWIVDRCVARIGGKIKYLKHDSQKLWILPIWAFQWHVWTNIGPPTMRTSSWYQSWSWSYVQFVNYFKWAFRNLPKKNMQIVTFFATIYNRCFFFFISLWQILNPLANLYPNTSSP